jgi:hypothetical protein
VGACLEIGTTEVAFSERERNLVEPALFPLFGLCQPEYPALGIQGCVLPARFGISAQEGADLLPKNPTTTAAEAAIFPKSRKFQLPAISARVYGT